MSSLGFNGLRVLSLESGPAKEIQIAKAVLKFGGKLVLAPALSQVKLESSCQSFAAALISGQFDMVIFLTGTGVRSLFAAVDSTKSREDLRAALERVQVVVRGQGPAGILNEFGVKANLVAPEPNTWREILSVLDTQAQQLSGRRVAVQESGVPYPGLLIGLRERGARVVRIPIYHWTLPEDLVPLQEAATLVAKGEIDVILLTSATQVDHLLQVAAAMGIEESLRSKMERIVIASIGSITSEHLESLGFWADLDASHPRVDLLVQEAAACSTEILREKQRDAGLDFLHEIGSHMADPDSLSGMLKRSVDFAVSVAKCDSCFVYLLGDNELVLRAANNPHAEAVGHLRLSLGEGTAAWVEKNRQPVAVSCNAFQDPHFQFFNEHAEDRYEAFLSLPILCHGQLLGVINLQHRQPHSYTRREIRLLSTIGFFMGAGIEMARLEEKSVHLSDELQARKVFERAKGILQHQLGISEEEAYLTLRRQSRQTRRSMKEVAEAVIRSAEKSDKKKHPA